MIRRAILLAATAVGTATLLELPGVGISVTGGALLALGLLPRASVRVRLGQRRVALCTASLGVCAIDGEASPQHVVEGLGERPERQVDVAARATGPAVELLGELGGIELSLVGVLVARGAPFVFLAEVHGHAT